MKAYKEDDSYGEVLKLFFLMIYVKKIAPHRKISNANINI